MNELQEWLNKNQLEKYQGVLIENDINTLELLAELSEDDLKELGFSLGDRKRFIIGIKDLASNSSQLSQEDITLIASLPYVIAYPLQQTLLEKHPPQRINLFKDTFLNYLKYLGLLSASEFFTSDIKDKGMVLLFQQNLIETAFGKWNHYIRESLKFLKEHNHTFFCPELASYYEQIETGSKAKKHKGEIEYIDANGDIQLKKQEATSIGMLINFRNRYLGHGLTLDAQKAEELWQEYFPIFRNLLEQLSFAKDYLMMKYEDGQTYLLHSSEITTTPILNNPHASIWIQNKSGANMDILPFFIVPGEVSLAKEDKEQMLTYESYTGKTIKFFSPEGTEKQTSGKLLEKLNLLLRDKQKEIPFTPQQFTKEEFLNRIADENKLLHETLINGKKIIPGVYQHREEMEIKLREWIGARANIFFIAAEAGSGKTNLLSEIQKQYAERDLPSLLIRAGRMEKQTLKEQIAYLLNIDIQQGLENYTSLAGTQAAPTFILIDGLNEANHAEAIWQEIMSLSTIFEPGSVKFVVTNRANTKADLERYIVSDKDQELLYGENKENEKGVGAYAYWLTAFDMKEMKGAWENYATKDKARFKPQFTFDAIAEFDRAIYNQINNPLILRLFLEIYNGKALQKKGNKHLHIWNDWFKTFSKSEQTFFTLLADAVWDKGANELLLDDLLNHETLKPYFTSDVINAPYARLKNMGWISSYTKELSSYVNFTVEGSLLYLLGIKLQTQTPTVNLENLQSILQNNNNLKTASIEAFLVEEALTGNLDLVSELIDTKDQDISICITPLVLFLKTYGVKSTIDCVFKNPTERDWEALNELDNNLKYLQLHQLRKEFLTVLMPLNQMHTVKAIGLGLKAITIFEKLEGEQYFIKIINSKYFNQEDTSLLLPLGNYYFKNGEYSKSINEFEKCYSLNKEKYGVNHILNGRIKQLIGNAFFKKGNMLNAIKNYQEALDINLLYFNESHIIIGEIYNNVGAVLDKRKEYDKALRCYVKALKIKLKNIGEIHTSVASSYHNIGMVWKSKGNLEMALENLLKSLDIRLKTIGNKHQYLVNTYYNIGLVHKELNNFKDSIINFELGFEISSNDSFLFRIAQCFEALKEQKKALDYFIQCSEIRNQEIGVEHQATQVAISNAKRLAKELGKEKELPEWMNL
jgi:tetratricopeptide (TPR) repeat protein